MELNKQKLALSKIETGNLTDVVSSVAGFNPDLKYRTYARPLKAEERDEARLLKTMLGDLYRSTPDGVEVEIPAEHFMTIRNVAEMALDNSRDVVLSLCTPNVCDGYRSEWRPAAFRIMAMTAEISEGIASQQ